MPDVAAVIPTFFVPDVRKTADWYVSKLGFTVDFMTADYGGVRLGPVTIHLAAFGKALKGAAYLRLNSGLDAYIAEIVARGQPLTAALKDHPEYGMREATVRDLDGNDLYIGQPLA